MQSSTHTAQRLSLKEMMRKPPWLFAWIVVCICALAMAQGKDDRVTVLQTPAVVMRHTYNSAHPPAQMPATQPDEAGVTVSGFSCVADVRGEIVHSKQEGNETRVKVQIVNVHIRLGLNVTEWMDELAPQKIWAHEDGHGRIALLFYDQAKLAADEIGRAFIGKTLSESGGDREEAGKKATTAVAQKVTDEYMKEVRDESEQVQEAYDRITAHGTNDVDEDEAIQRAMKEVIDPKAAEGGKSDSQ